MIRRMVWLAVVVMAAAAGAGLWVANTRLNTPFKAYVGPAQFVEIPPGIGARAIAKRLAEAGVVRDELTFLLALRLTGKGSRLKAGEYRFDRPVRPYDVVDQLAEGRVYLTPITFPEGLTIREMARIYESHRRGPASAFVKAAADASLIRELDPKADDLEGYLFPETYSLPRTATAEDLVRAMVARFKKVFASLAADAGRASSAPTTTVDVRRIVTLASLVEEETGKPEERPTVAAVYTNRLKAGMWLQGDPTVIYALQKAGKYSGNLTKDDLTFDSPYNTYRHAGLPPGPIASPGEMSLKAALAPANEPYLYFVSRNDGSHVFAKTLNEHNQNVFKFQVLPFRQKRLDERRQKNQRQPQSTQRPQRKTRREVLGFSLHHVEGLCVLPLRSLRSLRLPFVFTVPPT